MPFQVTGFAITETLSNGHKACPLLMLSLESEGDLQVDHKYASEASHKFL